MGRGVPAQSRVVPRRGSDTRSTYASRRDVEVFFERPRKLAGRSKSGRQSRPPAHRPIRLPQQLPRPPQSQPQIMRMHPMPQLLPNKPAPTAGATARETFASRSRASGSPECASIAFSAFSSFSSAIPGETATPCAAAGPFPHMRMQKPVADGCPERDSHDPA